MNEIGRTSRKSLSDTAALIYSKVFGCVLMESTSGHTRVLLGAERKVGRQAASVVGVCAARCSDK